MLDFPHKSWHLWSFWRLDREQTAVISSETSSISSQTERLYTPHNNKHTHGGVQSIDQYLSLAINVAGSEWEARVGGAAAFLAASVRPASVHSTLSIPCQLVALRHILPNTQETGTHPPTPHRLPPNAKPPGNGRYHHPLHPSTTTTTSWQKPAWPLHHHDNQAETAWLHLLRAQQCAGGGLIFMEGGLIQRALEYCSVIALLPFFFFIPFIFALDAACRLPDQPPPYMYTCTTGSWGQRKGYEVCAAHLWNTWGTEKILEPVRFQTLLSVSVSICYQNESEMRLICFGSFSDI